METIFEDLIQGLLENEYGYSDSFLDAELVAGLRNNLVTHFEAGSMHPAGVGRKFDYQKNTKVRGDVIRWIDSDPTDPWERQFMSRVKDFVSHLNATCYTAINAFEFHYAYYEAGSFYRRYLDQFKSDKGRKFSLVTYLNPDWKTTDGGDLVLYLNDGNEESILPMSGRAVFFKSDEVEHEVKKAPDRYRISIAGWLKSI